MAGRRVQHGRLHDPRPRQGLTHAPRAGPAHCPIHAKCGRAAWADDEDDAKDACKRIAENRDWDDTKAKVTKEGENRIVVTMTGERNNNDKECRCVYNSNSKEARFVGD